MSFDVHLGTMSTSPSAGFGATGGTSGIVIDNTVAAGTMAGASRVYYSTLGSSEAVQVFQSTLR
jgi:hypothetical protein